MKRLIKRYIVSFSILLFTIFSMLIPVNAAGNPVKDLELTLTDLHNKSIENIPASQQHNYLGISFLLDKRVKAGEILDIEVSGDLMNGEFIEFQTTQPLFVKGKKIGTIKALTSVSDSIPFTQNLKYNDKSTTVLRLTFNSEAAKFNYLDIQIKGSIYLGKRFRTQLVNSAVYSDNEIKVKINGLTKKIYTKYPIVRILDATTIVVNKTPRDSWIWAKTHITNNKSSFTTVTLQVDDVNFSKYKKGDKLKVLKLVYIKKDKLDKYLDRTVDKEKYEAEVVSVNNNGKSITYTIPNKGRNRDDWKVGYNVLLDTDKILVNGKRIDLKKLTKLAPNAGKMKVVDSFGNSKVTITNSSGFLWIFPNGLSNLDSEYPIEPDKPKEGFPIKMLPHTGQSNIAFYSILGSTIILLSLRFLNSKKEKDNI